MIAFWRRFFAGSAGAEPASHAPWSRMDTALTLWLLAVAIAAALAGLPTPAAAQSYDWRAMLVTAPVKAPPPGPSQTMADRDYGCFEAWTVEGLSRIRTAPSGALS